MSIIWSPASSSFFTSSAEATNVTPLLAAIQAFDQELKLLREEPRPPDDSSRPPEDEKTRPPRSALRIVLREARPAKIASGEGCTFAKDKSCARAPAINIRVREARLR